MTAHYEASHLGLKPFKVRLFSPSVPTSVPDRWVDLLTGDIACFKRLNVQCELCDKGFGYKGTFCKFLADLRIQHVNAAREH
jgi:hypothetical protein